MKLDTEHPSTFYRDWEKRFPEGTMLVTGIGFSEEELRDGYVVTPMDELFRFAMGQVGAVFRSAHIKLDRKSTALPIPSMPLPQPLVFKAYGSSDSDSTEVPSVTYTRTIFRRPVVFDALDEGRMTLEDAVRTIKTSQPVGGVILARFDDAEIALKTGFDYGKFLVNNVASFGDGQVYDNDTMSLNVLLRGFPWLNCARMPALITREMKNATLEETVAIYRTMLSEYLQCHPKK